MPLVLFQCGRCVTPDNLFSVYICHYWDMLTDRKTESIGRMGKTKFVAASSAVLCHYAAGSMSLRVQFGLNLQSSIMWEVIFSNEFKRLPLLWVNDLLRLLVGYICVSSDQGSAELDIPFWTKYSTADARMTTTRPISRACLIARSSKSVAIVRVSNYPVWYSICMMKDDGQHVDEESWLLVGKEPHRCCNVWGCDLWARPQQSFLLDIDLSPHYKPSPVYTPSIYAVRDDIYVRSPDHQH